MIHGSPVRLITFDGDEIFMFSSAWLFLFENPSDLVRDIKIFGHFDLCREVSLSKQQKLAVCCNRIKYKATSRIYRLICDCS